PLFRSKEHKTDFKKFISLNPFCVPCVLCGYSFSSSLSNVRHPLGRHHLEAALETIALAVVHDDLQLPLLVRNETERDHRIAAERDIRLHLEHALAFERDIYRLDEMCRRVVPRDLIHLHAIEVRMTNHELRPHRLADDDLGRKAQA